MEQLTLFISNHTFLSTSFFALLSYILFLEYRDFTQKFEVLSPMNAIQIINQDDTLILDVREKSELKDGKISNSKHIPLGSVVKEASSLESYKDKDIVIYCRSGHRSASACRMLTRLGFEKIYNLKGGIMAWTDAQLPVVKK